MHRVAENITAAECALGLESVNVDCAVKSDEWNAPADIHVVHTHLPDEIRFTTKAKVVWVAHGTPDHVFHGSVEAGNGAPYGHPDSLMLMQEWLRAADARVTFWPRHQWIYQRMVSRGTPIDLVPLGVDKAFWAAGASRGKYAGEPSVFTAENCHTIKWPYDIFVAWREVYEAMMGKAKLHAIYLPRDMHRWFFPLVNQNGCSYGAHISPITFAHDELRNVFKSIDFFLGLVRYGDFNQLSLQASAAGATTISYRGNDHADYWITEGDQREIAKELTAILKGDAKPREKTAVPDIAETAAAMLGIYMRVLSHRVFPSGAVPEVPEVALPTPNVIPLVAPRPRRKKPLTVEGIA